MSQISFVENRLCQLAVKNVAAKTLFTRPAADACDSRVRELDCCSRYHVRVLVFLTKPASRLHRLVLHAPVAQTCTSRRGAGSRAQHIFGLVLHTASSVVMADGKEGRKQKRRYIQYKVLLTKTDSPFPTLWRRHKS